MAIYYANFDANNGTHYKEPLSDTNKNRLVKEIRSIAEGQRFRANECSWCVWMNVGGYKVRIARGGMHSNGKRWIDTSREII